MLSSWYIEIYTKDVGLVRYTYYQPSVTRISLPAFPIHRLAGRTQPFGEATDRSSLSLASASLSSGSLQPLICPRTRHRGTAWPAWMQPVCGHYSRQSGHRGTAQQILHITWSEVSVADEYLHCHTKWLPMCTVEYCVFSSVHRGGDSTGTPYQGRI